MRFSLFILQTKKAEQPHICSALTTSSSLLLCRENLIHARSAFGALALYSWASVFHGNLLRIRHLRFGSTFHTVGHFCQSNHLLPLLHLIFDANVLIFDANVKGKIKKAGLNSIATI